MICNDVLSSYSSAKQPQVGAALSRRPHGWTEQLFQREATITSMTTHPTLISILITRQFADCSSLSNLRRYQHYSVFVLGLSTDFEERYEPQVFQRDIAESGHNEIVSSIVAMA